MQIFIRFQFGNYNRYTYSFPAKFLPPREQHKELCEGLLKLKYLHDPEIKELYDMFGLTDAEIEVDKHGKNPVAQLSMF